MIRLVEISIDENLCKGCKYCIVVCPREVLAVSEKLGPKGFLPAVAQNRKACVACKLCETICPDFAICVDVTS